MKIEVDYRELSFLNKYIEKMERRHYEYIFRKFYEPIINYDIYEKDIDEIDCTIVLKSIELNETERKIFLEMWNKFKERNIELIEWKKKQRKK